MKQAYVHRKFTPTSLALIETIDEICSDYQRQHFVLTVRQLYYQLVARNIIPNNERSYKNTTSLVNDARLAGLVDWDAIEDRTREFISRPRWGTGKEFLESVAPQYHTDLWSDQENRVFVIVEKEALVGVLQRTCYSMDVPLLAARGYPSVSVLREFARYQINKWSTSQDITILHLGDHDPSGIDMTRDLADRLYMLCGGMFKFNLQRIALNMDQIEENSCPPNPAKLTDSRSSGYVREFGYESWELDALEPSYLVNLVEDHIWRHIDKEVWEAKEERIDRIKDQMIEVANQFEE